MDPVTRFFSELNAFSGRFVSEAKALSRAVEHEADAASSSTLTASEASERSESILRTISELLGDTERQLQGIQEDIHSSEVSLSEMVRLCSRVYEQNENIKKDIENRMFRRATVGCDMIESQSPSPPPTPASKLPMIREKSTTAADERSLICTPSSPPTNILPIHKPLPPAKRRDYTNIPNSTHGFRRGNSPTGNVGTQENMEPATPSPDLSLRKQRQEHRVRDLSCATPPEIKLMVPIPLRSVVTVQPKHMAKEIIDSSSHKQATPPESLLMNFNRSYIEQSPERHGRKRKETSTPQPPSVACVVADLQGTSRTLHAPFVSIPHIHIDEFASLVPQLRSQITMELVNQAVDLLNKYFTGACHKDQVCFISQDTLQKALDFDIKFEPCIIILVQLRRLRPIQAGPQFGYQPTSMLLRS